MRRIRRMALMTAVCFTTVLGQEKAASKPGPYVVDAAQIQPANSSWGNIKWLCNATLSAEAPQTVGVTEILPGQSNPIHFHPNCEELLYVISGRGTHSYDGQNVELKAGMMIRIPSGVKHNVVNTGSEPFKCLVVFNTGDRKTVFLEKK